MSCDVVVSRRKRRGTTRSTSQIPSCLHAWWCTCIAIVEIATAVNATLCAPVPPAATYARVALLTAPTISPPPPLAHSLPPALAYSASASATAAYPGGATPLPPHSSAAAYPATSSFPSPPPPSPSPSPPFAASASSAAAASASAATAASASAATGASVSAATGASASAAAAASASSGAAAASASTAATAPYAGVAAYPAAHPSSSVYPTAIAYPTPWATAADAATAAGGVASAAVARIGLVCRVSRDDYDDAVYPTGCIIHIRSDADAGREKHDNTYFVAGIYNSSQHPPLRAPAHGTTLWGAKRSASLAFLIFHWEPRPQQQQVSREESPKRDLVKQKNEYHLHWRKWLIRKGTMWWWLPPVMGVSLHPRCLQEKEAEGLTRCAKKQEQQQPQQLHEQHKEKKKTRENKKKTEEKTRKRKHLFNNAQQVHREMEERNLWKEGLLSPLCVLAPMRYSCTCCYAPFTPWPASVGWRPPRCGGHIQSLRMKAFHDKRFEYTGKHRRTSLQNTGWAHFQERTSGRKDVRSSILTDNTNNSSNISSKVLRTGNDRISRSDHTDNTNRNNSNSGSTTVCIIEDNISNSWNIQSKISDYNDSRSNCMRITDADTGADRCSITFISGVRRGNRYINVRGSRRFKIANSGIGSQAFRMKRWSNRAKRAITFLTCRKVNTRWINHSSNKRKSSIKVPALLSTCGVFLSNAAVSLLEPSTPCKRSRNTDHRKLVSSRNISSSRNIISGRNTTSRKLSGSSSISSANRRTSGSKHANIRNTRSRNTSSIHCSISSRFENSYVSPWVWQQAFVNSSLGRCTTTKESAASLGTCLSSTQRGSNCFSAVNPLGSPESTAVAAVAAEAADSFNWGEYCFALLCIYGRLAEHAGLYCWGIASHPRVDYRQQQQQQQQQTPPFLRGACVEQKVWQQRQHHHQQQFCKDVHTRDTDICGLCGKLLPPFFTPTTQEEMYIHRLVCRGRSNRPNTRKESPLQSTSTRTNTDCATLITTPEARIRNSRSSGSSTSSSHNSSRTLLQYQKSEGGPPCGDGQIPGRPAEGVYDHRAATAAVIARAALEHNVAAAQQGAAAPTAICKDYGRTIQQQQPSMKRQDHKYVRAPWYRLLKLKLLLIQYLRCKYTEAMPSAASRKLQSEVVTCDEHLSARKPATTNGRMGLVSAAAEKMSRRLQTENHTDLVHYMQRQQQQPTYEEHNETRRQQFFQGGPLQWLGEENNRNSHELHGLRTMLLQQQHQGHHMGEHLQQKGIQFNNTPSLLLRQQQQTHEEEEKEEEDGPFSDNTEHYQEEEHSGHQKQQQHTSTQQNQNSKNLLFVAATASDDRERVYKSQCSRTNTATTDPPASPVLPVSLPPPTPPPPAAATCIHDQTCGEMNKNPALRSLNNSNDGVFLTEKIVSKSLPPMVPTSSSSFSLSSKDTFLPSSCPDSPTTPSGQMPFSSSLSESQPLHRLSRLAAPSACHSASHRGSSRVWSDSFLHQLSCRAALQQTLPFHLLPAEVLREAAEIVSMDDACMTMQEGVQQLIRLQQHLPTQGTEPPLQRQQALGLASQGPPSSARGNHFKQQEAKCVSSVVKMSATGKGLSGETATGNTENIAAIERPVIAAAPPVGNTLGSASTADAAALSKTAVDPRTISAETLSSRDTVEGVPQLKAALTEQNCGGPTTQATTSSAAANNAPDFRERNPPYKEFDAKNVSATTLRYETGESLQVVPRSPANLPPAPAVAEEASPAAAKTAQNTNNEVNDILEPHFHPFAATTQPHTSESQCPRIKEGGDSLSAEITAGGAAPYYVGGLLHHSPMLRRGVDRDAWKAELALLQRLQQVQITHIDWLMLLPLLSFQFPFEAFENKATQEELRQFFSDVPRHHPNKKGKFHRSTCTSTSSIQPNSNNNTNTSSSTSNSSRSNSSGSNSSRNDSSRSNSSIRSRTSERSYVGSSDSAGKSSDDRNLSTWSSSMIDRNTRGRSNTSMYRSNRSDATFSSTELREGTSPAEDGSAASCVLRHSFSDNAEGPGPTSATVIKTTRDPEYFPSSESEGEPRGKKVSCTAPAETCASTTCARERCGVASLSDQQLVYVKGNKGSSDNEGGHEGEQQWKPSESKKITPCAFDSSSASSVSRVARQPVDRYPVAAEEAAGSVTAFPVLRRGQYSDNVHKEDVCHVHKAPQTFLHKNDDATTAPLQTKEDVDIHNRENISCPVAAPMGISTSAHNIRSGDAQEDLPQHQGQHEQEQQSMCRGNQECPQQHHGKSKQKRKATATGPSCGREIVIRRKTGASWPPLPLLRLFVNLMATLRRRQQETLTHEEKLQHHQKQQERLAEVSDEDVGTQPVPVEQEEGYTMTALREVESENIPLFKEREQLEHFFVKQRTRTGASWQETWMRLLNAAVQQIPFESRAARAAADDAFMWLSKPTEDPIYGAGFEEGSWKEADRNIRSPQYMCACEVNQEDMPLANAQKDCALLWSTKEKTADLLLQNPAAEEKEVGSSNEKAMVGLDMTKPLHMSCEKAAPVVREEEIVRHPKEAEGGVSAKAAPGHTSTDDPSLYISAKDGAEEEGAVPLVTLSHVEGHAMDSQRQRPQERIKEESLGYSAEKDRRRGQETEREADMMEKKKALNVLYAQKAGDPGWTKAAALSRMDQEGRHVRREANETARQRGRTAATQEVATERGRTSWTETRSSIMREDDDQATRKKEEEDQEGRRNKQERSEREWPVQEAIKKCPERELGLANQVQLMYCDTTMTDTEAKRQNRGLERAVSFASIQEAILHVVEGEEERSLPWLEFLYEVSRHRRHYS